MDLSFINYDWDQFIFILVDKCIQLFLFTTALALRSRDLVIGSREKEEKKEEKKKEEEKNLQIAVRCL